MDFTHLSGCFISKSLKAALFCLAFPEQQSQKVVGLSSLRFSFGFPQFDAHMFAFVFLTDPPNQYQMSKLSAESRSWSCHSTLEKKRFQSGIDVPNIWLDLEPDR